jgi:Leucine-rich repeat (LRR) protein
MPLRRVLIKATLFGLAVYGTHCFILTAQTPNPSKITTLTISEENAILLKKLKDYSNLEVLSINCVESLQAIPDDIGQLKKLRELNMNNGNGCSMNPKLPESIGNLQALEKLDLYGAQDPRPVGNDYGPQPTRRHEFPKSMSQLKALTYLDLGRNGLEDASLPELRTLRLDADGLTEIPDFLRGSKLSLITLGNNCTITTNATKKKALEQRFHGVKLDFEDDYDCPDDK